MAARIYAVDRSISSDISVFYEFFQNEWISSKIRQLLYNVFSLLCHVRVGHFDE